MTTPQFPSLPGLTFPVKRYPRWKSLHQQGLSGIASVQSEYTYPLWEYEVSISPVRAYGSFDERQTLMGLYNTCGGAAQPFLYDDPTDDTATNQQFGTGDGTTTSFQLLRTLGGFTEPVFAPTISDVYVAGTATSAYTLGANGLLTFATAPTSGDVLTWTGTYSWLCRFEEDSLDVQKDMSGYWSVKTLKFRTVIPP